MLGKNKERQVVLEDELEGFFLDKDIMRAGKKEKAVPRIDVGITKRVESVISTEEKKNDNEDMKKREEQNAFKEFYRHQKELKSGPSEMHIKSKEIKETEILKEERFLQKSGPKRIMINIVMDGTFSFSLLFPQVYYGIQGLIREVKRITRQYEGVRVKWGLTVFHEEAKNISFEKVKSYYTEDTEELLEALRNIVFYGGNSNGKENINEAVELAIRNLENNTFENESRGLLLFTDSMPEETAPCFRELEGCSNNGLRFVIGYLHDSHYYAKIKLVDRDGEEADNQKNEAGEFMSIQGLINSGGMEFMKRTVTDILKKTSVIY